MFYVKMVRINIHIWIATDTFTCANTLLRELDGSDAQCMKESVIWRKLLNLFKTRG